MSLKETRLERSAKFLRAIALRGRAYDLDPEGEDFKTIKEAYQAAEPLLEPMRLRRLKDKDLDQRFLEILEYLILPYHRLVSQHGMEYFDKIRQHPDSSIYPELALYRTRKRDLVEKWKKTYSKKRVKRESSAHTQEG